MSKLNSTMIGVLGISIISIFNPTFSSAQCSLTCNAGSVQVALDANCLAFVSPDDILEGSNTCIGPLTVQVFDLSGTLIPTSPFVDDNYIGQTLPVQVVDEETGNFCESSIIVLDNINPVITCSDRSLTCNASTHPDDIGYAMVTDNCTTNPTLSYSDEVDNMMCDPNAVMVITRTWTAMDASGNEALPCVQTITLQRPDLADVQFPANRDDVSEPALDCVNPDLSPENTGYPTLNGFDLINGNVCEILVASSDSDPLAICEGSYTILRTWTITEECGIDIASAIQLIKVTDGLGPVLNCPNDFTVSTTAISCTGNVIIPGASVSDNCSSNANIAITITNESGVSIAPNSIVNLPVGIHPFLYTATDDCGNVSTCTMNVTIDDGVNPVAICNAFTTVALGSAGTTMAPANTFDDGSYDNCGPLTFLARRMDNPNCSGNDASVFDTMVPFYCCDVGDTIMVEMRIEDATNRLSNSCMVEVIVQDKLNPEITCPSDITLDCDHVIVDPTLSGEPQVSDNCGVADVSYTDTPDLNMCNVGTILRTWTVLDDQNQSAVCVQRITLVDNVPPVITFPASIYDAECTDSDDFSITGEPIIDDACGSFGVNKDDSVLEFDGGCVRKIVRVWTVYDWCEDTTYVDVQVIKEFDTTAPVFSAIPSDMTVECDAVPPMDMLTAMDACDNGAEVLSSETTNSGSCSDEYTIIRKWMTTDNCGNADSITQVITVVDTTDPVILGESPDTTINCDAIIPESILTATDNCDTNVDLTMTEVTVDGACSEEYMLVRTWTATDNCGNQIQRVQTITIQDTIAPTIIGVPVDLSIECDVIPDPALVTATDNCDQEITVSFNESIQDGICTNSFIITRTWTATDNCGNQTSQSQTIDIGDTTAPVLSEMPTDLTVDCGMIPDPAVITATDNCDDNITVDFDEVVVNGSCLEDITVTRTWTATDACGNTTSTQQVISSSDTDAPILIGVPADMTVECGAITQVPQVTAMDNCATNIIVDFNEVIVNGSCDEDVTVTRTWTATDNCGNTTTAQQVISSADIEAPILIGVPLDLTVSCGIIPDAPVITAMDNCLTQVIVVFDESSVIGSCNEDIVVTRTWTATDNCGNTASGQQTITSSDIQAPTLSEMPDDITVTCGVIPGPPVITATDDCATNITVMFNETEVVGNCNEDIVVTRTWTATDNCGNTVSTQQTITSSDTEAPTLSGVPQDTIVECGIIPAAPIVTAMDNCATNIIVMFSETEVIGSCNEDIVVTRTWTATDNCGNTVSAQQTITSSDTEAPTLSSVPADMTVQCESIPDPPVVTAMDNCDMDVLLVFDETITEQNCDNEFVLLWTWTATDNCGNVTTTSTTLEVIDNIAPTLFGVPANITVECTMLPDVPVVTATDNCDPTPEVLFEELITEPSCGSSYQIFRTWTGVDTCQNQSIRTQIITLFDTTAPVFTDTPADITAECDNIPPPDFIAAEDECANGEMFEVLDSLSSGICTGNYTVNRIWTVTDSCGNNDRFIQIISVEDNTPPMIECPDDITFNIIDPGICEFLYSASPTILDNCDPTLDLDFEIDFGNDGTIDTTGATGASFSVLAFFPIGVNEVTFNVTDDCGNVSSCSMFVTVNDFAPPSFRCRSFSVNLNSVDSTAFVIPSQFLLEPFDECCLDTLLIEDLDTPNLLLDTLFLDYDDFIASQTLGWLNVRIFAIDCYGNEAFCGTRLFITPPNVPPGFASITGEIITEEDEFLENIQVNIDGGISSEDMTSSQGNYEFMELPEGYSYYIEPFHNEDPLNGLSTWDIILLHKHILQVDVLDSPYKMIAADVNGSGHISTLDIIELRKLILGITPSFSSNTSWRFIDANYLFPNSENPFESTFPEICTVTNLQSGMTNMNFVAIKTGDLNNSAETNLQQGSAARNLSTVHFETVDQILEADQMVTVPITAKDFKAILGFQYSMEFDPNQLEFIDVGETLLPKFDLDNFGINFSEQGLITCSWMTLEELSKRENEVLFELNFKVKKEGQLSNALKLNSAYTKAELYRKDKDIATIDLQFIDSPKVAVAFELFQNRPNPFKEETLIGFSLSERSEVVFSVFNASGNLIWQRKGTYPEGYSEFAIQRDELESSGLYFYQLKTPGGISSKRMILVD